MYSPTASDALYGLDAPMVWDRASALRHLIDAGAANSIAAAERRLEEFGLTLPALSAGDIRDECGRAVNRLVLDWAIEAAHGSGQEVLFAQLAACSNGVQCLRANDDRGHSYWVALQQEPTAASALAALRQLQVEIAKDLLVLPHGALVACLRDTHATPHIGFIPQAYPPVLSAAKAAPVKRGAPSPHLRRLEDESIFILREAVAEAQKPVMLYSIGKDSGVMLHLARKAFYPAPPPFALLHVDTRWKFQEMYLFRDRMAAECGMELLVHVNPEAVARDVNPFDHGSQLHTEITKTEALKQALDRHGFDVVFGGARRDEEKSRAKERVFSVRSGSHAWEPKKQRPELWNLYNTRKGPEQSIRVFPLSNWTELDVWQYIYQEDLEVVPLYFAKPRAVVVRQGMIMAVDDERFRLLPGERVEIRKVRFRTLGCYPLTGAIESDAESVGDVLMELVNARASERQGRLIDSDGAASMEMKKREGYF